jgi:hypothetical protein
LIRSLVSAPDGAAGRGGSGDGKDDIKWDLWRAQVPWRMCVCVWRERERERERDREREREKGGEQGRHACTHEFVHVRIHVPRRD